MQQAFRQLEERSVSSEVVLMEWSPKMDLIALANKNGEVLLQRLTWQKQPIWVLPPSADDEFKSVTALAWRPDGKVLSVGYSCGKVILCSVEGAGIVHTTNFGHAVGKMKWSRANPGETSSCPGDQDMEVIQDASDIFLPKLPSLTKVSSTKEQEEDTTEDLKKLKDQSGLNLLVVCLDNGNLHILAFGIAPVAEVILKNQEKLVNCGRILSAALTPHLYSILVIVELQQEEAVLVTLDSVLLASRHQEIANYAKKYAQISALMEYLEGTLKAITEAKEDILLEIEAKLTKYAEQKLTEGTVGDEFLDLLVWGKASLELQTFLLQELTAKGLKKLGHSVESSYSSIQKLILKQVHRVGKTLLFELSELYGMAGWYDKYGILGLSPETIQGAMAAVGSFLLKSNELLQVIENSLKNFKAFFRWLFVQMMRMMEEPVIPAVSKMYQKDINFVADFLEENFSQDFSQTESRSGFTLEHVGQYFKKEDLSHPFTGATNPWLDFVETHPKLKDSPLFFPNHRQKSLVQLHDSLVEAVDCVLVKTGHACGQSVTVRNVFPLFKVVDISPKPSHKYHQVVLPHIPKEGNLVFTIFFDRQAPVDSLYLLKHTTNSGRSSEKFEVMRLTFGGLGDSLNQSAISQSSQTRQCQKHKVLDAAFYDDHTLSVLLQECDDSLQDCVSVLCQLPISSLDKMPSVPLMTEVPPQIENENISTVEAGMLVSHFHRLENLRALQFAVSGSRKVACVLFLNGRRVRLFDMDTEEEEDPSMMDSSMNTTQHESDNITSESLDL